MDDSQLRNKVALQHALTHPAFSAYEKEIRVKMMDPKQYPDHLRTMYPDITDEEIDTMNQAKDIEVRLYRDKEKQFINVLVEIEKKKDGAPEGCAWVGPKLEKEEE